MAPRLFATTYRQTATTKSTSFPPRQHPLLCCASTNTLTVSICIARPCTLLAVGQHAWDIGSSQNHDAMMVKWKSFATFSASPATHQCSSIFMLKGNRSSKMSRADASTDLPLGSMVNETTSANQSRNWARASPMQ